MLQFVKQKGWPWVVKTSHVIYKLYRSLCSLSLSLSISLVSWVAPSRILRFYRKGVNRFRRGEADFRQGHRCAVEIGVEFPND